MSSRRSKGRVSHAQRFAITAPYWGLYGARASKFKRTGPRHGARLAMEMSSMAKISGNTAGHGDRRWKADRVLAIVDRLLAAELEEARRQIALRHNYQLTLRYHNPLGNAQRSATMARIPGVRP